VNFLPLLWSHRRALVLSAVVALLVAVPFGLLTPASYTSTSTVLFPTTEPGAANGHGETVLSLRLQQYTDNDYATDVNKALGKQAGDVSSVSANQSKPDPIQYDVSVDAGSAKHATSAIKVATKVLTDKYAAITQAEVDHIQSDVTSQLGPLTSQKSALDAQIAAKKTEIDALNQQISGFDARIASIRAATAKDVLAGSSSASGAADRAIAPIQAQENALLPQLTAKRTELDSLTTQSDQVGTHQTTLLDALSTAQKTYVSGLAVSNVSPPDTPTSNTLIRLIESTGLAIILALALSCVAIVWLERSPIWRWVKNRFHSAMHPAEDAEPAAPVPAPVAQPANGPPPHPAPAASASSIGIGGPPAGATDRPELTTEPSTPAAPTFARDLYDR